MLHLHPSAPVSVSPGIVSPGLVNSDRALRLHLSERDLRIILSARCKLQGARVDFSEAIRALREAVEESIPAGRIFLLGQSEKALRSGPIQDPIEDSVSGPIIGSLVSGVGIAEGRGGVLLLRRMRDGRRIDLGRFVP